MTKKKFWILLGIITIMSVLGACGKKTESNGGSNNSGTNLSSSTGKDNKKDEVNWDEVDSALEVLESLKPEGWDENKYGMYIYDVYDSTVLPTCIPKQIEGTLAYCTTIKDYKHDVINGNYGVGPIYYNSYEDYREYGVSFYANKEHLRKFIEELEASGMYGQMDVEDEAFGSGSWWEGFYGGNGWAVYLMYNTNDDKNGEFDGCLNVSVTDNLYELPKSVAGISLPQTGIVTFDYNYYTIQDFSNGYEDIDFDMKNGTFPKQYFAAWVDYYCVCKQDAMDYVKVLEQNGWTLKYTYENEADEYSIVLEKDNVYALVDYEEFYMEIGFSDMIENLTY